MSGIGHNSGSGGDPGRGWRRHCWRRARADLLPHLPIEVLRNRVRRARELGLDYRSYAALRAASGHDVVALLFSSNALRVLDREPRLPPGRRARLEAIEGAAVIGLAQAPLRPETLAQVVGRLDAAHAAPALLASFRAQRVALRAALDPGRLPGDRVVLVGDHRLEAEWCAAGGLAGYVAAERYFATV